MKLVQAIVKSIWEAVFPTAQGSGFYPLMNSNYRVSSLTRSDYIRLYTGWQYLAVSTIANSVAELEYSLTSNTDSDKPIKHQHLDLVNYRFLQQVVSSIQLTGSAYYRKVMIGSKIDELQYMRTDLVTIEEHADGRIKGYRYNHKQGYYLFSPDEVIDFSLYSPMQTFPETVKGVSPMQAVAMQAELDQTATRWNWNFFKNNASVWGVLKTDKSVSKEDKARAVRSWKEKFMGVNNSSSIAFLDNGITYDEVKVSQKELDFVESRRFTRDEVLAVFKVPKAIVGITDDVNRATAQTAERIFYRTTISPLTVMIQEVLNEELFYNVWYFQFVNVNPLDKEELRQDYESGAITLNEYRQAIGKKPLKNGDFLKLNALMSNTETQYTLSTTKKSVDSFIEKTIAKNMKGTDEYRAEREKLGEKLWKARVNRSDKYESLYMQEINKIFKEQEQRVTEQIRKQKGQKVQQPKLDLLVSARWIVWLKGLYETIMQTEGNEAINSIGVTATFDVGTNSVNKFIRDAITLTAKQVNETTSKLLSKIIKEWNDEGLSADQIARNISDKFEEFTKKRSLTIARTEITNASTQSQIMAWKQTGVVEKKERYTALDERVCPECNAQHTRVVDIDKQFPWWKDWPTEHPNCRCTLLAVVD